MKPRTQHAEGCTRRRSCAPYGECKVIEIAALAVKLELALGDLWNAIHERHYGRMPSEVEASMTRAYLALGANARAAARERAAS